MTASWSQAAAVRLATLLSRWRFVKPADIPPRQLATMRHLIVELRRTKPMGVKM